MHLIRRLFQWPWRCAGAIQTASPDAACPRLLQKPLDAGIRWLLAPYCPSGRQGNRPHKQQSRNTPAMLAILMAMAMRRYVTACIAQWRRSRASLKAIGCRHWASIMPDNIHQTWPRRFFLCFHHQNCRKRSWVDAKNPVFHRDMTYQTKEKGLIKVSI